MNLRKEIRKALKEQKIFRPQKEDFGWFFDNEGGWADIPLLKGHLDSSFVGIHNDGTYYFDTEDPLERSGDMLSFRGFSEVLHRLGLKVDAHKVSDQLYKLAPRRLKIDLIETDMSLWEEQVEKKEAWLQDNSPKEYKLILAAKITKEEYNQIADSIEHTLQDGGTLDNALDMIHDERMSSGYGRITPEIRKLVRFMYEDFGG
ncbi:MAG: hypothetical protein PHU43_11735 [Candidatus Bipolaricaulis sp.]|nr:hypothetical protein [Candidatus Bipolaricaulis sp.]